MVQYCATCVISMVRNVNILTRKVAASLINYTRRFLQCGSDLALWYIGILRFLIIIDIIKEYTTYVDI